MAKAGNRILVVLGDHAGAPGASSVLIGDLEGDPAVHILHQIAALRSKTLY